MICRTALSGRGPLMVIFLAIACITAVHPRSAQAQATPSETEKLEQEFTDPLTTLPQLFFKDAYSPATFGTRVQTNTAVLRAIIPRVPPYSLLPFMQLIRPTFTAVTVPSPRGGSRTEFGDTQLFDLAVPPWPGKQSGLAFGVGPTFVFPTATSKSAGQGAWQAGPALAAGYYGIPWFLIGFLFQNPMSFAYTSSDRPPQSTLEFQPVVLVHAWRGWYFRSADATWTVGWRHNSPSMIPLSLGVGRVMVRPGLPPINLYVAGQWMAYRQFAPVAPQTTINFGITVAFPEFR
jgi:hypothetical protein